MEILAVTFIALIVGFYIGWKIHEMFIIHIIETDPDIMEEACRIARKGQSPTITVNAEDESFTIETAAGETVTAQGIELMIEQVNGVLYAYAKASGQFIAQADTLENLMHTAHNRFPGKTFFGEIPEQEVSN